MNTISNLKKALEIIELEGHGEAKIEVGVEEILLLDVGIISPDSPAGAALDNLGVHYSTAFGWAIYT